MEHLGTKAETLALMYGKLNTAKVLPQLRLQWQTGNGGGRRLSAAFRDWTGMLM